MRILLTCEDFFPHIGGAEVCVYNLKNEYERLGHFVTVFTNTVETTERENGIVRLPWKFSLFSLWHQWCVLWNLVRCHDVVHSQYSFRLACFCALITRLQGKSLLLTQQGRGIVPESSPSRRGRFFYILCQWISMKGARLITSTSAEITDLTAAFVSRSKIISVTNGYDSRLFVPSSLLPIPQEYHRARQGDFRFLTVRRLVPKNGIHILVQALGLVKKVRTDFHYFAIGDGRVRLFIESLVREFGLEDHVTLLGSRSNEVMPSFYQSADLVLVPSSAEATSIACIEAMGMKKPLIASRVGGLIDLLGKTSEYGLLVPIYDSESCTYSPPDRLPAQKLQVLADAILSFMDDPQPFFQRAEKAALLACSRYSWEAIAAQYYSLYESFSR